MNVQNRTVFSHDNPARDKKPALTKGCITMENREGTSKGIAWVKINFSSQKASRIIDRAEKFLKNMNFTVIGKGCSSSVEREDGEVVLNENLGYQKREWRASLYYIYLEYGVIFNRSFFPSD